jgi:hypothetical protein
MQGDGPLYRYEVIDSPLDESSWDDCLTFAEIEGRLMVTFITINTTVKVDKTDNKNEYIKTNPLDLERTSTIRVKHMEDDSEPLVIDLLDRSEDHISGDELDDTEEEEEEEEEAEEDNGKKELPGMSEDITELGSMPITNNSTPRNLLHCIVELEHQDFEIHNAEGLDLVDTDFNNIAVMELEGANNPNVQAQKEDQADNADVDW